MEGKRKEWKSDYDKLEKEEYSYDTDDAYLNPREAALKSYSMEEYMAEIEREKLKKSNKKKKEGTEDKRGIEKQNKSFFEERRR